MDFNKVKVEITWSDHNVGCKMTEDGKVIEWHTLTREEQIKILNSLATLHNLFGKFLKEG